MAGLDQMRRELERKARLTGVNTARDVESRLRRTSPTASGNMRARTRATAKTSRTGSEIDIIVDTDYAHIVADGQRPHDINANVLIPGVGWRYIGRHPGAQGHTWWDDTLKDVPALLARNWRAAG